MSIAAALALPSLSIVMEESFPFTMNLLCKKELQRVPQPNHYELGIGFAERKVNKSRRLKLHKNARAPRYPGTQEVWVENLSQRELTGLESQLLQKTYPLPSLKSFKLPYLRGFRFGKVDASYLVRKINNKFLVVELHNTSQRFSRYKGLIKGFLHDTKQADMCFGLIGASSDCRSLD